MVDTLFWFSWGPESCYIASDELALLLGAHLGGVFLSSTIQFLSHKSAHS